MITKRNGNGQTECRGCKEKGKFALTWDSLLYNFNDKPYCYHCLLEKLEELQERIDKAIEYINYNDDTLYTYKPDYDYEENLVDNYDVSSYREDLLKILGDSND